MRVASGPLMTIGVRSAPITRRRLLRGALQTAGLAALAPALGFSFVSEFVTPSELRAFDAVAARLSRLADASLA